MKVKKSILIFLISFIIITFSHSSSYACWGSRPLAMGGAFTGVADDANAIYWNPAGLVQMETKSITTMHNLGYRSDSNYDHYIGLAFPVTTRTNCGEQTCSEYGTVGLAYTINKDRVTSNLYSNNELYSILRGKIQNDFLYFGYGKYLFRNKDISLGINLKRMTKEKEMSGAVIADPETSVGTYTYDEWFDFDLGGLWSFGKSVGKYKQFSLGCLFQNVAETETDFGKEILNVRPGFAFRPEVNTLLSLEIYDALGNSDTVQQDIRLGAERWLFNHCLALRLGGYHINNTDYRAYTFGIGLMTSKDWKRYHDTEFNIDYTLMHWDEADENTYLLSLTYNF